VLRTRTTVLVHALFLFSGACTLVYELIWVRMLVPVFGTSVFAVSTVLTAFMAGLALGSALFGRWIDRRGKKLLVYAYLEAGIGLFALLFPFLLAGLDVLCTVAYRQLEGSPYAFSLVRFLLSFLLLLVPTTLMGGTLPVLSKFLVERLDAVGRSVGGLYAINTLGAAVGCFVTAFYLMERLGLRGTSNAAAFANLLIAAFAFLLSRRVGIRSSGGEAKQRREEEAMAPVVPLPPGVVRLTFWGFAISGFTALGYEVVWARLLAVTVHITTIQSLSTILVTFLFGLAAGGAAGAALVDRLRRLPSAFGVVEMLLGLCGLGSIAVIGAIPSMQDALSFLPLWWGHMVRLFALAFGVMLIPTCLMGLLFPIAGRVHAHGLPSLGRRIGNIYAANTTGAVLGAFAAGFVLIPFVGTQGSIAFLAWTNIAVGAAVLLSDPVTRLKTKTLVLGGTGAAAVLLTVFLPTGLIVGTFEKSEPGSRLLYHEEGPGGTVTVHENADGQRLLRVNGAGEVPTDRASIQTFRLLGSLPLVLHSAPEEVLVIAFGGGVTLATVEMHGPRRIDCVEIVPEVLGAASHFAAYNNSIFERLDTPGIDVIIDDGRNHILRTERRYDVIISDSTHPGTADSWVLYTEEFYRLSAERLKEGGIIAQWLPLHGLTADNYRLILRTFQSVFPHASLWLTTDYSVLLGTPRRLQVDFDELERKLGREDVRTSLAEVDLGDPVSFLATLALDEEAIESYVGVGSINTDDSPDLCFTDRLKVGAGGGLFAMSSLLPFLPPQVDDYVVRASMDDTLKLDRRLRARRHTVAGTVALKAGARQKSVEQFERALAFDPDEREAALALERGR